MQAKTIFVTGIDTGIGKSVVTGVLAARMKAEGKRVITQKMIQTGCEGISDDILLHRKLMNEELNVFDVKGVTCPYLFPYPASPHLAAKLEKREINEEKIHAATQELERHYDVVLLEGAGGLYVPINEKRFIIDYIRQHGYPVILVTSSRLGGINHTLLSLEVCKVKGIPVYGVAYNLYPRAPEVILNDTCNFFKAHLAEHFPNAHFWEIPALNQV